MATLQNIRNRSGLLIGVIGFAMLAFILMDLLGSGKFLLGGNQTMIVEVNGEGVQAQEFFQRVEKRVQNYITNTQTQPSQKDKNSMMDAEYDQIIREKLLNRAYDELAIKVCPNEMWEEILLNPNIQQVQFFIDENGVFNPDLVKQYMAAIKDGKESSQQALEEYINWVNFEQDVKKRRLNQKYFNLIKKSMFITTNQADKQFNNENYGIAARYIYQPFTSIADSLAIVANKEVKKYFNTNIEDYKTETSRDIEYVIFDLKASEEDKNEIRNELAKLLDNQIFFNSSTSNYDTIYGFKNTENDSIFVFENTETSYFDGRFYKTGKIGSSILDSFLFKANIGDIYGPYIEGDYYKIAKLSEITYRPDSVKARHILINPINGNDYQSAREKADSLKKELLNGADFTDLVQRFSNDPGSIENKGVYDWFEEGVMVPEFNDICFTGKPGEYYLVNTQFGVHLIEILNKKGNSKSVKYGIIDRKIIPSEDTETEIYTLAAKFLNEAKNGNFNTAINSNNLSSRSANGIKKMDYNIAGIGDNREIVKWAYGNESNIGSLKMFETTNQFIVATLSNIIKEGYQNIDDVYTEIEFRLRKKTKGEIIADQIATLNAESIENIAASLDLEIKSLANYKIISSNLPGIGLEPELSGEIFGLEKNTLSSPIIGNNGVFVFYIDNDFPPTSSDVASVQSRLQNNLQVRTERESFDALKDNSSIFDNRFQFY